MKTKSLNSQFLTGEVMKAGFPCVPSFFVVQNFVTILSNLIRR